MISLHNLSLGFNNKPLLGNITVSIEANRLTSLIGRNGSGKSTLMKTICGLNDKYSGNIFLNETELRNLSRARLASVLAFVNTQRPNVPNLKCKDIVALGRSPHTGWHGKLTKKDIDFSEYALELVGMKEYGNRYLHTLSDGECQKIMIARAIAQDTPIILLDEPTSFLDLPSRYEIVTLLKKLTLDIGKTIVFSTHELDIALEMSDDIALIQNKSLVILPVKKMIESGNIQRIFSTPNSFIDRYLSIILQNK